MNLMEVPIRVAPHKELEMQDEMGTEPEWKHSQLTLNPEYIYYVHPDVEDNNRVIVAIHDSAKVVLMNYEEFVVKWKEALE